MALLKPVQGGENEKRVQTVLASAEKALELLKSREQLTVHLEEDLEILINGSFPLPSSTALAQNLSAFDSLGRDLWNAATNIIRESENQDVRNDDSARIPALLRVFAFLLLDTTHRCTSNRLTREDQRIRNFKVALKACRVCLDKGELGLALKVLERCSDHITALEEDQPLINLSSILGEGDHESPLRSFVKEFYLLRTMHAWKSDRLDLAEHFYCKFSSNLQGSNGLAEKAADLFYEIGKSLFERKFTQDAVNWLQRALEHLDAFDVGNLSQDAAELRMAITASLVDSLLCGDDPHSVRRAQGIVDQLFMSHGLDNRMPICLMRLNVLLAQHPPDEEDVAGAMLSVLRFAVPIERNFKMIMKALHRVQKASTKVACDSLRKLICDHLLPDLRVDSAETSSIQEYVERACVAYVLFVTSDCASHHSLVLDGLQNTFNVIVQHCNVGFSPKATHAAQALIWKATGAVDSEIALRWCDLLRHPLFDGAGKINQARIGRKAMAIAIAKNDFDAAREAFFHISSTAQNESITRYLAFKMALRTNDREIANESLNVIMRNGHHDQTFLYACVLESQQSEMRYLAVGALQAILDKRPPHVHLPSLLRCVAHLLAGELQGKDRSVDEVMSELVRTFESAAANMPALKQGGEEQCRAEIQWWSKNAYNISLQHCGDMHPEYLVRLLNVCTQFIDCYPNEAGIMHQDSIRRRKALCHFLASSALVALARASEERSECSLQRYLQARNEIEAFCSLIPMLRDDQGDMKRRMFELLKFELECILHLQQWDRLDSTLSACLNLDVVERWDTLADVVLIIRQKAGAPGLDENVNTILNALLERIINDTWKKDNDLVKASRWLRLTFTRDLAEDTGNFALKLLQQAAGMARKGYDKGDDAFPETELQWLATTSFNKAVDLLSSGLGDESEHWIQGALELARNAADNGALHANLTYRREQAMARIKAWNK